MYIPLLKAVLNHPKAVVAGAVLIALVGFWPADKLGSEFIPPLDEGDLMYMPTTYPGLSVGKARELLQTNGPANSHCARGEERFWKVGRAETATDPAPLT